MVAAIIAIYIVLGILYESFIHPITILTTLPSAGLGAVAALFIFGIPFTIIALIGVILLIGIVKKNAIMMIDFALQAEREEGLTSREAIFRAAMMRFRPIMMTTSAALLGALPLCFALGEGSELRQPLGISIVGGLIVSQALTLYTTPIVYLYLDRLGLRLWRGRGAGAARPQPPSAREGKPEGRSAGAASRKVKTQPGTAAFDPKRKFRFVHRPTATVQNGSSTLGKDRAGSAASSLAVRGMLSSSATALRPLIPPQSPLCAGPRVTGRKVVGEVRSKPFDGEAWIDAKGFGDERLRLVHLAQERIGSGEDRIDPVGVIAGVERLSVFDDRGLGTTGANFCVAEDVIPDRLKRIMRTRPNRLLQVGFGLVEMAKRNFCRRSRKVDIRIIWIDGEAGVGGADRLVKAVREAQVTLLNSYGRS